MTEPHEIKGFQIVQKVISEALDDKEYRERLRQDPQAVLREAGLEVPAEMEVVVVENRPTKMHLVIPAERHEWDKVEVDEVRVHLVCEWPL